MKKPRIALSKETKVNTYAQMWAASEAMLGRAKGEPEGSYYQLMGSLIFTAFTLEAYLNHIGERIFKCWNDLEPLSPSRKLNVVAEKLGIDKDDGRCPFQTVLKLLRFRNDVAHGKSVSLKSKNEVWGGDEKIREYMHKPLETAWQRYCTLKNAKEAREDVKSVIEKLQDKANLSDDILFSLGTWSALAELAK